VTHGGITTFASPLSIEFIDTKTEQALMPDIWKTVFAKAKAIYDIPNNKPKMVGLNALDVFIKDQNAAMVSYWTNGMFSFLPDAKGLDWDVVQLPTFAEAPNKYLQADYHQYVVSRTSKHIDDAIDVIKTAISPEVQTVSNRNGKLTVLDDAQILDQFAADLDFVKGKNIKGIFKSGPSKLIAQTDLNPAVGNAVRQAFVKVFDGKADINTALREAKEQADQKVAELKAAK
jgi:multiple sugar transport system substrate-binding protein